MFEWLVGEVSEQSENILRRFNASLTFNPRTDHRICERSRAASKPRVLAIVLQMY
jgi:hypothetical protein